ncbi:MAG: hypothetical protein DCC58_03815 [Chloroflexi bacterium]|nr:MAG: hypothetical protein DCC58_03815 [Chloroflexota bacterium]
MLRKHLFKTAFSFFALIAAAAAVSAQSPSATPPVDDDEPIRIDSRLIVVPVSVVDANGQPVTGLTQADFQISEEGRRQQIESVGSADSVPLDIALLFDVSASTDAMFRFQQETAVKFLKDVLRAEDRAAIFTIGEKALLVSGLAQAGPATESVLAIPVAAGVLYPNWGIHLRPEWAALLMSASSIVVATNAVLLKRAESMFAPH